MFVIVVRTREGSGHSRSFGPFSSRQQAVDAVPFACAQVDGWLEAEVVEVKELVERAPIGPVS